MEIRNRGAYPQYDEMDEIGDFGYIWVGGFDSSVIELTPRVTTQAETDDWGDNQRKLDVEALEGKSEVNREGGYSAAVIEGRTYICHLELLFTEHQSLLQLLICIKL